MVFCVCCCAFCSFQSTTAHQCVLSFVFALLLLYLFSFGIALACLAPCSLLPCPSTPGQPQSGQQTARAPKPPRTRESTRNLEAQSEPKSRQSNAKRLEREESFYLPEMLFRRPEERVLLQPRPRHLPETPSSGRGFEPPPLGGCAGCSLPPTAAPPLPSARWHPSRCWLLLPAPALAPARAAARPGGVQTNHTPCTPHSAPPAFGVKVRGIDLNAPVPARVVSTWPGRA